MLIFHLIFVQGKTAAKDKFKLLGMIVVFDICKSATMLVWVSQVVLAMQAALRWLIQAMQAPQPLRYSKSGENLKGGHEERNVNYEVSRRLAFISSNSRESISGMTILGILWTITSSNLIYNKRTKRSWKFMLDSTQDYLSRDLLENPGVAGVGSSGGQADLK